MRTSSIGLGLAVVSAATFGTAGPFADSLMASGWTPGAAVILRIGIAAVVLTVPALVQLRGRWALLRRAVPTVLAYGALAVAGAQLFFFNAIQHLSVGVALLLEYSGTLLVVVWMWLRHGQTPRRLTIGGGVLAVAGLVLVLDLTGHQHVSLVGVLWGLGAAFGLATYFVLSGRADDPVPPIVTAWAGMVVAATALVLAAAVGVLPFHAGTADADFGSWHASWVLSLAGVSLVAAVTAYVTGIHAARRLGARLASFIGLAEVLFAVLFAWLLLGQRPGLMQGVGGLLVLAGIALVRLDEPAPVPPPATADLVADSTPPSVASPA